jgi:hypothetical protein
VVIDLIAVLGGRAATPVTASFCQLDWSALVIANRQTIAMQRIWVSTDPFGIYTGDVQ